MQNEVPDYQFIIWDPQMPGNVDESGFPLCVSLKNVYHIVTSSQTQITVMVCFNIMTDQIVFTLRTWE